MTCPCQAKRRKANRGRYCVEAHQGVSAGGTFLPMKELGCNWTLAMARAYAKKHHVGVDVSRQFKRAYDGTVQHDLVAVVYPDGKISRV